MIKAARIIIDFCSRHPHRHRLAVVLYSGVGAPTACFSRFTPADFSRCGYLAVVIFAGSVAKFSHAA